MFGCCGLAFTGIQSLYGDSKFGCDGAKEALAQITTFIGNLGAASVPGLDREYTEAEFWANCERLLREGLSVAEAAGVEPFSITHSTTTVLLLGPPPQHRGSNDSGCINFDSN